MRFFSLQLPMKKPFFLNFSQNRANSNGIGFTLIEMLIAVSLIGILSTIGLTMYSQGQKLARDTKRKQDLKEIKTALNLYFQDTRTFPQATTWVNSFNGGTWIPGLTNNYIDRIPQDPRKAAATCTVHTTSSCYLYGYLTLNSTNTNCPPSTQHFVLAANLENASDQLANAQQAYSLCDGTTFLNTSLYIISNNID